MKTDRRDLDFSSQRFGDIAFTLIGHKDAALKGKVTIVHIRQPAHCAHPSVMHKKTRELLVAISGTAKACIGRRRVLLRRGAVVDIPPGTWHSFHAGRLGVEALSIFVPAMSEKNADVFVRQAVPSPKKHGRS